MTAAPKMDLIGSSRYALAANALTIGRLLLAPVLALLVLERNPWWLTFVLGWVLGATDLFDGRLARNATPTRFGAFFDPLADKAVVLLTGYAVATYHGDWWLPMAIITVREVAIQGYRSYWSRRQLAIPARTSAKYKTFVQGLALAAAMCPLFDDAFWVATALLWLAVAFTVVTGLQYVLDGRDALRTGGAR
ncbi:MAG: CDP-alcohol phosphatidyltransferase family protein [Acidimicrobiales bacterium]